MSHCHYNFHSQGTRRNGQPSLVYCVALLDHVQFAGMSNLTKKVVTGAVVADP
jgi:hypothetical protein